MFPSQAEANNPQRTTLCQPLSGLLWPAEGYQSWRLGQGDDEAVRQRLLRDIDRACEPWIARRQSLNAVLEGLDENESDVWSAGYLRPIVLHLLGRDAEAVAALDARMSAIAQEPDQPVARTFRAFARQYRAELASPSEETPA
ncbi:MULTISPECIES: hypothetical protein [unclassified Luteococcus]|uniref:hypothetical protein n=1 Tax=unclassified Luteococcus TaxID=2639923 RepID=UPI00313B5C7D